MPDTSERASPPVPPRLVVSGPPDENLKAKPHTTSSRPTLASRRRSKTESSALKATGRQPSLEWIDIDDSPKRRKKTSSKRTASKTSSSVRQRSRSSTESEVASSRFSPKLSRISESSESRSTSRPSTSGSSQARKQREKDSPRKTRRQDDSSIIYRRPAKHRVGGVSRKPETGFKLNPSLLSVLSTLTGTSDRSSSSNTTITQQSYDRRNEVGSNNKRSADPRGSEPEGYIRSHSAAPPHPNVFDFMDTTAVDDGHDGRSIYSTSSVSSHEHSDAGSSELPDTPSSHSTFPSPSSTRNSSLSGSVAELRRKYDPQFATSTGLSIAARRDSHSSPETAARPIYRKLAQVRSVPEEDDEEHDPQNVETKSNGNVSSSDERRRTSLKSPRPIRPIQRPEERLRYQEEAMRHHLAQSQHGPQHLVDPVYGQHRSHSTSSRESSNSAQSYPHPMAVQHYQYPSPPAPPAYPSPHVAPAYPMPPQTAVQPPAPDPPDFSQRTIAGYEQFALELSNPTSNVKPLYRKFSYLNHRILLHMQDELCEMEDQLRCIDEAIAQMSPGGGPASRRGDAFNGSEMHHHRTALLGRIFLKTEQYQKAMKGFGEMEREGGGVEEGQVEAYQGWLKEKAPIHEVETRFLQASDDLIRPGKRKEKTPEPLPPQQPPMGRQVALTCLPFALMLPLLLFSVIPTLAGRLVVTALIAIGAVMVGATTRARDLLEMNEWAVCGGVYVLLMTAIAGCIPVHGT